MNIAISSQGTSLDAWAGGAFGACSQFLVVDTETMGCIVVSVPPEQLDPDAVSLAAIRAIATQGTEVVITGPIKDVCRQALENLGIEVVEGIERMTVREAVATYVASGLEALASFEPPPAKIAIAAHSADLEGTLSRKGEVCTSFVLVDPQTMDYEIIEVESVGSPERASVTAEIRPACCKALRALAITVALADEGLTVREAVAAYRRGELSSPAYL